MLFWVEKKRWWNVHEHHPSNFSADFQLTFNERFQAIYSFFYGIGILRKKLP